MQLHLPALVPALALAARAAILAAALPRMSHADARAWRADLASEEVHNEYVRRGDSATLRVAVYLRGREYRPAAAVARYRAGLDSPDWLQAPCTVSSNVVEIAWSPMLAPGADVIPMLVHVDGEVYRVPVMLYVRDSPGGGDPGGLPVLDFDAYNITNAPWATPACVSAAAVAATNYTDSVVAAAAAAATNYTAAVATAALCRVTEAARAAIRGGDDALQRRASTTWGDDLVVATRETHDLCVTYWVRVADAYATAAPCVVWRPGPLVVAPGVLPESDFGSRTNAVAFAGGAISAAVDWDAHPPLVANTNAAIDVDSLRGRFRVWARLGSGATLDLGDGSEPRELPPGVSEFDVTGLSGVTTVTVAGPAQELALHVSPVAVQEMYMSLDLADTIDPPGSGAINGFWWRAPWWDGSGEAPRLFVVSRIHLDATTNYSHTVTFAPNGERLDAWHGQPMPSTGIAALSPLGSFRFGGFGMGDRRLELGFWRAWPVLDRRVWHRALSDEEMTALFVAGGGSALGAAGAVELIARGAADEAAREAAREARAYAEDQAEAALDLAREDAAAAVAAIPAPDLSKLPAAPDITLGGTNLVGLLPEYIAAPETVRTNVYTGVSRDTELRDGKLVLLYLATQPSSAFSLNLQLADGSWTGAKPVRFWGTTAAGTQISAGSIIHIVYRGGAWFWSDRDTNNDTYDRVRINQEIRAASAIGRNSLCGADTNGMGYVKLAPGAVIDPAMPLLYLNRTTTLSAGSRDTQFYAVNNIGTTLLTYHGVAGKQRSPLYLLGSLDDDGRAFTVGDPAFSYEPEPPCFPLGLFHAATTNSFYFIPGPLISGQPGGDASAVTNLVADLLADEVEALPVQSTLEVHRLVLADLWDRVGRMAGASDADAIEDILLALDGLDARLTALEGAASVNAVRMSEIAGLMDTQLSGTLRVDSGGVASDRSAGEEALVRGDVAPTSD